MANLRRIGFTAAVMLAAMLFLPAPAGGESAADITGRCTMKAGSGAASFAKCRDRNYRTYWQSANGNGATIEVTVPEGETASGVMVQWYEHPHAWGLQLKNDEGQWEDAVHSEGSFLAEWLPLPEGTVSFRIANAPGEKRHFNLAELRIFGAGDMPGEAQMWQPSAEKADLMLVVAHPDDEVLWFGGALPTYAGQEKKNCQICMLVPSMPYRRLELLDCLWTCGVRQYPVWGGFPDAFSGSLKKQYTRWNKSRLYEVVTEWIRRFRPDVVLTHDLGGEYGHGGHRACADAVTHALTLAANRKKYPRSVREYGIWDVPKCYVHLYPENSIEMDWREPLPAFDGRTSFDIAEEAFRCHISQQSTDYRVEDTGPTSCTRFGLYRSLVGEDMEKDDFFENIP